MYRRRRQDKSMRVLNILNFSPRQRRHCRDHQRIFLAALAIALLSGTAWALPDNPRDPPLPPSTAGNLYESGRWTVHSCQIGSKISTQATINFTSNYPRTEVSYWQPTATWSTWQRITGTTYTCTAPNCLWGGAQVRIRGCDGGGVCQAPGCTMRLGVAPGGPPAISPVALPAASTTGAGCAQTDHSTVRFEARWVGAPTSGYPQAEDEGGNALTLTEVSRGPVGGVEVGTYTFPAPTTWSDGDLWKFTFSLSASRENESTVQVRDNCLQPPIVQQVDAANNALALANGQQIQSAANLRLSVTSGNATMGLIAPALTPVQVFDAVFNAPVVSTGNTDILSWVETGDAWDGQTYRSSAGTVEITGAPCQSGLSASYWITGSSDFNLNDDTNWADGPLVETNACAPVGPGAPVAGPDIGVAVTWQVIAEGVGWRVQARAAQNLGLVSSTADYSGGLWGGGVTLRALRPAPGSCPNGERLVGGICQPCPDYQACDASGNLITREHCTAGPPTGDARIESHQTCSGGLTVLENVCVGEGGVVTVPADAPCTSCPTGQRLVGVNCEACPTYQACDASGNLVTLEHCTAGPPTGDARIESHQVCSGGLTILENACVGEGGVVTVPADAPCTSCGAGQRLVGLNCETCPNYQGCDASGNLATMQWCAAGNPVDSYTRTYDFCNSGVTESRTECVGAGETPTTGAACPPQPVCAGGATATWTSGAWVCPPCVDPVNPKSWLDPASGAVNLPNSTEWVAARTMRTNLCPPVTPVAPINIGSDSEVRVGAGSAATGWPVEARALSSTGAVNDFYYWYDPAQGWNGSGTDWYFDVQRPAVVLTCLPADEPSCASGLCGAAVCSSGVWSCPATATETFCSGSSSNARTICGSVDNDVRPSNCPPGQSLNSDGCCSSRGTETYCVGENVQTRPASGLNDVDSRPLSCPTGETLNSDGCCAAVIPPGRGTETYCVGENVNTRPAAGTVDVDNRPSSCSSGEVFNTVGCCGPRGIETYCDASGTALTRPASGTVDVDSRPASCPSGEAFNSDGCCESRGTETYCDSSGVAQTRPASGTSNVDSRPSACGSSDVLNADRCCVPRGTETYCVGESRATRPASGTSDVDSRPASCPPGQALNGDGCCAVVIPPNRGRETYCDANGIARTRPASGTSDVDSRPSSCPSGQVFNSDGCCASRGTETYCDASGNAQTRPASGAANEDSRPASCPSSDVMNSDGCCASRGTQTYCDGSGNVQTRPASGTSNVDSRPSGCGSSMVLNSNSCCVGRGTETYCDSSGNAQTRPASGTSNVDSRPSGCGSSMVLNSNSCCVARGTETYCDSSGNAQTRPASGTSNVDSRPSGCGSSMVLNSNSCCVARGTETYCNGATLATRPASGTSNVDSRPASCPSGQALNSDSCCEAVVCVKPSRPACNSPGWVSTWNQSQCRWVSNTSISRPSCPGGLTATWDSGSCGWDCPGLGTETYCDANGNAATRPASGTSNVNSLDSASDCTPSQGLNSDSCCVAKGTETYCDANGNVQTQPASGTSNVDSRPASCPSGEVMNGVGCCVGKGTETYCDANGNAATRPASGTSNVNSLDSAADCTSSQVLNSNSCCVAKGTETYCDANGNAATRPASGTSNVNSLDSAADCTSSQVLNSNSCCVAKGTETYCDANGNVQTQPASGTSNVNSLDSASDCTPSQVLNSNSCCVAKGTETYCNGSILATRPASGTADVSNLPTSCPSGQEINGVGCCGRCSSTQRYCDSSGNEQTRSIAACSNSDIRSATAFSCSSGAEVRTVIPNTCADTDTRSATETYCNGTTSATRSVSSVCSNTDTRSATAFSCSNGVEVRTRVTGVCVDTDSRSATKTYCDANDRKATENLSATCTDIDTRPASCPSGEVKNTDGCCVGKGIETYCDANGNAATKPASGTSNVNSLDSASDCTPSQVLNINSCCVARGTETYCDANGVPRTRLASGAEDVDSRPDRCPTSQVMNIAGCCEDKGTETYCDASGNLQTRPASGTEDVDSRPASCSSNQVMNSDRCCEDCSSTEWYCDGTTSKSRPIAQCSDEDNRSAIRTYCSGASAMTAPLTGTCTNRDDRPSTCPPGKEKNTAGCCVTCPPDTVPACTGGREGYAPGWNAASCRYDWSTVSASACYASGNTGYVYDQWSATSCAYTTSTRSKPTNLTACQSTSWTSCDWSVADNTPTQPAATACGAATLNSSCTWVAASPPSEPTCQPGYVTNYRSVNCEWDCIVDPAACASNPPAASSACISPSRTDGGWDTSFSPTYSDGTNTWATQGAGWYAGWRYLTSLFPPAYEVAMEMCKPCP